MTPVELMKLLAEETRLMSVIHILQGPRCVCDLMALLDLSQPKVSRHLAILREAGLVTTERKGLWVYYSLASGLPAWVYDVIAVMREPVIASNPETFTLLSNEGGRPDCC